MQHNSLGVKTGESLSDAVKEMLHLKELEYVYYNHSFNNIID